MVVEQVGEVGELWASVEKFDDRDVPTSGQLTIGR